MPITIPLLILLNLSLLAITTKSKTASIAPWSTIPRDKYSFAIGHDNVNNVIWLVGDDYSLISFDVNKWNKSDAFTDYGATALSYWIYAYGQAYVQKDNILYCIYGIYNQLMAFDLQSATLTELGDAYTSSWSCLSNIDHYIIYTWKDIIYIFDINTQKWLSTSAPLMHQPRMGHACTVQPINEYLYVMGGTYNTEYFDSIEKLYVGDIENIHTYQWAKLNTKLSVVTAQVRCILHGYYIYIIGGVTGPCSCSDRNNKMDILDTMNDMMIGYQRLAEPISGMTPILVGNRIYIFGGYNGDMVDYWQYIDLDASPGSCEVCDEYEYDPVCCNGLNYSNPCQSICECVTKAYIVGACDVPFTCMDNDECDYAEECNDDGYCEGGHVVMGEDHSGEWIYVITALLLIAVLSYAVCRLCSGRERQKRLNRCKPSSNSIEMKKITVTTTEIKWDSTETTAQKTVKSTSSPANNVSSTTKNTNKSIACSNCKTINTKKNKFCGECGVSLSNEGGSEGVVTSEGNVTHS